MNLVHPPPAFNSARVEIQARSVESAEFSDSVVRVDYPDRTDSANSTGD
jgi:hypothetical protein